MQLWSNGTALGGSWERRLSKAINLREQQTSVSTQGLGLGWVCHVLMKILNVPSLAITLTLHPDREVAVM